MPAKKRRSSKKKSLPKSEVDPETVKLKKKAFDQGLINKTKPDTNGFETLIPEGLERYNDQNIMNKAASRGNKRYLFVFPGRFEQCEIRGSRRKITKEDTKDGVQVKSEGVKIEKQDNNGQIKTESVKVEQNGADTPVKTKKRAKLRKQLGTLANLNTNKPVLYIDYPQGRLKLCGTILYPKNKYLAIKYSLNTNQKVLPALNTRGVFDSLVIFSDYYWVGTKEENPEEKPLPFPDEIKQKPDDFYHLGEKTQTRRRSGTSRSGTSTSRKKRKAKTFDSSSDSSDGGYEEPIKPIKRSKRSSRKKISYTELDAGDYVDGSSDNEDVMAKYNNNNGTKNGTQNDSPQDDYLPTYDD